SLIPPTGTQGFPPYTYAVYVCVCACGFVGCVKIAGHVKIADSVKSPARTLRPRCFPRERGNALFRPGRSVSCRKVSCRKVSHVNPLPGASVSPTTPGKCYTGKCYTGKCRTLTHDS